MKRFYYLLCAIILSSLALANTPPNDSYFFMDAGVNIVEITPTPKPKVDTIITYHRDTLVEYQEYTTPNIALQNPILVQNSAHEQRMFGVKKYSYGDLQMDEKALVNFLLKNNQEIYADYVNATKLITAGWWLFGGGILLAVPIGVGCGVLSEGLLYGLGIPSWAIGGAAFVSAIPILCIGYNQKNHVFATINNSRKVYNLSLSFQINQTSVGLALNF